MFKGLENQTYLVAYIISNAVALVLLFLSWKRPRLARLLFVLLFAWACWINWTTASQSPQRYMDYADLAFLDVYREAIQGWFSGHIQTVIGIIATCQGLVALGLLFRGRVYKIAVTAGIVFLVAIAPFGVGSAFPCTLVMAFALFLLLRQSHHYLWRTTEDHDTLQWQ